MHVEVFGAERPKAEPRIVSIGRGRR